MIDDDCEVAGFSLVVTGAIDPSNTAQSKTRALESGRQTVYEHERIRR